MKTKSENRKALPFFFLFILCSLGVGILFGIAIAKAEGDWTKALGPAIIRSLVAAAPWALYGGSVMIMLAVALLRYRVKKRLGQWQEEDEDGLRAMDGLISAGLLLVNIFTILSFFLIAAPMCALEAAGKVRFFVSLGGFLCSMAVIIISEQLLIDMAKELYPEKRGSVYDMKFQKTWFASCDEAERAQIGQAAIKAYQAGSTTCLLLWVLLVMGNLLFSYGLMPVAVVSVIWLVLTVSYTVACMRLEKRIHTVK